MNDAAAPIDPGWLKEALVRLNVQGPRYTSYPTAPQWAPVKREEIDEVAQRQASQPETPLSVYVHVPFCDRRCLFCGCNVVVRPKREKIGEDYIARLRKEVELRARHYGPERKLVQLHFGGGTPNYLSPDQLQTITDMVIERFSPQEGMEFSIEVDPCDLTPQHITQLRKAGLNRVSLGVQDFDEEVQDLIKRHQTVAETERAMKQIRDEGIDFLNVDLIYGLPGQTLDTFRRTIDQVIEMGATRLAIYSFAHIPWIRPHQKRIDESRFPNPEAKLNLYIEAFRMLTEAGFVPIGMDHFALPEDELTLAQQEGSLHRNFMGYTTHAGTDLLGLGVSSISYSAHRYTQNYKKLPEWEEAIADERLPVEVACELSEDDRIRSELITQIICNFKLNIAPFESKYGIAFDDYFSKEKPALENLKSDGLIRRDNGTLEVTPQGRFFVRNICMAFDVYLKQPTEEKPIYSKTI